MVIYIRKFRSLYEFQSSIDEDISEMKKHLGELLRVIENLRARADNEKALKELLVKLGMNHPEKRSNVISLKNLKIVVNPAAEDELQSLESLAELISRRITTLQNIKKELELFSNVNVEAEIEVVYLDNIPKEVYIRY